MGVEGAWCQLSLATVTGREHAGQRCSEGIARGYWWLEGRGCRKVQEEAGKTREKCMKSAG